MTTSPISEVVRHLRRAVLLREGAGLTDGQLLERFVSRRDTAALEVLVRRHGPMVWGVCRRLLRSHHDAEDAFQATFLVLVRRAASVVPREMVGNWLYGVARQTALKARATAARRREREGQVRPTPEPSAEPQELWPDLQPLLDQELSRLPDKYRVAVVLCDLEGKSRKEAARQLGLPEGTVASRLARARALLAKRLAGRGLALGSLAAAMAPNAASASVPSEVLSATIRAARLLAAGQAAGAVSAQVVALTEGVLKAMLVKKLKLATAALLVLCVVGFAAGTQSYPASGREQPVLKKEGGPSPTPQGKASEKGAGRTNPDKAKIQGRWRMVKAEWDGMDQTSTLQGESYFVFQEDTFEAIGEAGGKTTTQKAFYRLDGATKPKEFDFAYLTEVDAGQGEAERRGPFKAVYDLDGDTLRICYALVGKDRPAELATRQGQKADVRLLVFQREKGKQKK